MINMQELEKQKTNDVIPDIKIPIRMAFIKPNGNPAVISLWYVPINDKICCATQKKAKIVSYLQKNPVCGFEIARDEPPYKGVRGEGDVEIISKKGEEILSILIKKYLGKKESTLSKFLEKNSQSEVAIQINPKKIFPYDYSKRMKEV